MGGIITKDNASNLNKIPLYRASHHKSGEFFTFFTNLSGLICSLNASEHHDDEEINLYVYNCNMNLRQMSQMIYSDVPPVKEKYLNKQYGFCAKIYDFAESNDQDDITKSQKIESEYGDFFVAKSDVIDKICNIHKVYNLKFKKFKEIIASNLDYQNALKNVSSIEKNNELFNRLITDGIIKELPVSADGKIKRRKSRSKRKI